MANRSIWHSSGYTGEPLLSCLCSSHAHNKHTAAQWVRGGATSELLGLITHTKHTHCYTADAWGSHF
eukprot:1156840-Pelagomonas_calceolata.AAC.3